MTEIRCRATVNRPLIAARMLVGAVLLLAIRHFWLTGLSADFGVDDRTSLAAAGLELR